MMMEGGRWQKICAAKRLTTLFMMEFDDENCVISLDSKAVLWLITLSFPICVLLVFSSFHYFALCIAGTLIQRWRKVKVSECDKMRNKIKR